MYTDEKDSPPPGVEDPSFTDHTHTHWLSRNWQLNHALALQPKQVWKMTVTSMFIFFMWSRGFRIWSSVCVCLLVLMCLFINKWWIANCYMGRVKEQNPKANFPLRTYWTVKRRMPRSMRSTTIWFLKSFQLRSQILKTTTTKIKQTKNTKLEAKGLEINIRMLNSIWHYTGDKMAPMTEGLLYIWGFWNCNRYHQKRHGKIQKHMDPSQEMELWLPTGW